MTSRRTHEFHTAMHTPDGFVLRPARKSEIDSLNQLIMLSSSGLGKGYYTDEEIQHLNAFVFGVDSELIDDGTYFVIEKEGQSVACGGWSKRATLFGGDQIADRSSQFLNPATEAAKIRAFFVHPHFARRGLAQKLILHCEAEAHKAGFSRLELMSTLPGVPFYEKMGYRGTEKIEYKLPNGVRIKFMPMSRELPAQSAQR